MPCDRRLKAGQTLKQRAAEVQKVTETVAAKLATNAVRVVVGPTGGVAFVGLTDAERDGVTDACIYRRVMSTGSALARAALQRQEAMQGRTVDRAALAHGHHSHDGGQTWHQHKG